MDSVSRRTFSSGVLATGLLPAYSARAQQGYPAGLTIKVIVPFPPGGTTDIVGRIVADRLAAAWKVTAVVENVAGAAGNIGISRVAKDRSTARSS